MNINNIYIPNNKKVVKKKHYLIDNIIYAQRLGVGDAFWAKVRCDFVRENNLNSNKRMTDEVFTIIKMFKNRLYDALDVRNNIDNIIGYGKRRH